MTGFVRSEEEDDRSGSPAYPGLFLVETLAALALLVVLLLLAALTKPPLGEVADPTASGFVPEPDWYFLWLFQTLKYFNGSLEPVGTFLLPAVAIVLLLAIPFLDRRQPKMSVLIRGTRPVRVAPRVIGVAFVVLLGSLTLAAADSSQPAPPPAPALPSLPPPVWP